MYKKGNGSNGENQNSGSNSHNNHRSNNSSNDLNDGSDSDDDIELDFEDVFGVADYGSARLKTEGMGHVITHGQQQQHLARSFPGSTKEKTDSEYFADLYNEQDFMQGLSQMMLTVQSKPVSASSLEQEDIDRMTEQEFEHYSQVVDSVQRQLLLTQDCV